MSSRPVIALLTDFGLTDHYVGVMKGVIAGACPDALVIDITHGVPAQDIRAAAFELEASWRYFPEGTVFVVIVDPGVGTDRPVIAARIGDRFFIGPDNGVFDLVIESEPTEAVVLGPSRDLQSPLSRTFEGRDRMAPAAAWLAQGTPLADLGMSVGLGMRLPWTSPAIQDHVVDGEVVHVDRFGNLVTNIRRRLWPTVLDISGVCIPGHAPARLVRTYGEGGEGECVALFGSTDRLELAVVRGSAAAYLAAGRGTRVRVSCGA